MDKAGYLGIVFLMFLENVFPPIPSELIMPMGGMLAREGRFSFPLLVAAGTAGSFVGQALLYELGRRLGPERLKRLARSHGHWVAVSEEEIDRAQDWFAKRRGSLAVFLGRLLPGIRSLISIPAGVAHMPVGRFLLWTLLGTGLWTWALALAGRMLADNYDKVESYLNPLTAGFLLLVAGSYLRRVIRSFQKSKRGSGSRQSSSGPTHTSAKRPRHV